ncbi:MAG: hypothetical protein ACF8LL_02575, partial [Phycisphaerales bacterium]
LGIDVIGVVREKRPLLYERECFRRGMELLIEPCLAAGQDGAGLSLPHATCALGGVWVRRLWGEYGGRGFDMGTDAMRISMHNPVPQMDAYGAFTHEAAAIDLWRLGFWPCVNLNRISVDDMDAMAPVGG